MGAKAPQTTVRKISPIQGEGGGRNSSTDILHFHLPVVWQVANPYRQASGILLMLLITHKTSVLQSRPPCLLGTIKQSVIQIQDFSGIQFPFSAFRAGLPCLSNRLSAHTGQHAMIFESFLEIMVATLPAPFQVQN